MIPPEMFSEDLMGTMMRYALYMGAVFQIMCIWACGTLCDEPADYTLYNDKVTTDSDDCSSEQSSPGHRAAIKGRKQEKKKRR